MSGLNQQFTKLSALNWAREFESRSLRNGYGYIITYMHRFTINTPIKIVLALIGLYELLLAKTFLLAAVMTPIMFLMGSDASPGDASGVSILIGWGMIIIFWICTPLSFVLNWYMVFSKKPDHPKWFLLLVPLPFIGLLGLSYIGLGLKPFIPYFYWGY